MPWTTYVVICALTSGCGGPKRESETPLPVATPPPASTTSELDRLTDHVRQLGSRLSSCRNDQANGGKIWLGAECRKAIRSLVAGCGTADLRALEATDRVTEPCKESLWKLLPERDSHRSRLLIMGAARTKQALDVYVATSDENGEPAPAIFDGLRIQLEVEGRLEVVQSSTSPLPIRCDAPIFAASSILDYSGSMSDRDVDESIEILRTVYDAIPEGCLETDVILFSKDVRRRAFSSDRSAMKRAVTRDDTMPRRTTALVDALGDGAQGVSKRPAPVRMLIVATDGKENASTRWSHANALRTAQAGHARIISFGSLLSDTDFLEALGAETGGFFIYRPHPRILAAAARTVGRLLASTHRIHIVDGRLAAATHVVVEHGTQRVRVPIR